MLGIAADNMEATITLEKDTFEPGEEIRINFDVDNSRCSNDVKSYKVKLYRDITVFKGAGKKTHHFTKGEYVIESKDTAGAKAKTSEARDVKFKIPEYDSVYRVGPLDTMHPCLQPLAQKFSFTHARSIFSIMYRLDVFVKH